MHKLLPGKVVIASHNEGKVAEFRALLAPYGMEPVSAKSLGLPEPEETGTTFSANALLKAVSACDLSGLPVIADDSGLCVEVLGGDPGVYTANWAETEDGRRDWNLAMGKVEEKLQALGPNVSRAAHFTCTLAVAWPDGSDAEFEGRIEGTLTWPPRGSLGHGYDPVFVPLGETRTFAELSADEKNAISHRAVAFRKLVDALF